MLFRNSPLAHRDFLELGIEWKGRYDLLAGGFVKYYYLALLERRYPQTKQLLLSMRQIDLLYSGRMGDWRLLMK